MDARLTLVTLGVDDFKRALKFYRDGLGWKPWKGSAGDWVLFPLAGGIGLAIWPRRLLSKDAGVKHCTGYGGVTLAHNVAKKGDVDRLLAKAVKAGVRIGFGTDSGIYPHGDNARQFAYMVKYGMTPLDAIRSATLSAAASLGRSQELGSIATGKFADLIAINGDPLEDIDRMRNVAGVIKQGLLIHQGGAR